MERGQSAAAAANLIDAAISLIERDGWWSGKADNQREHCPITALDICRQDTTHTNIHSLALDTLIDEIPESFKLTYGSYTPYIWITMYNDYTDKETVLAWMRRAAANLRGDTNACTD